MIGAFTTFFYCNIIRVFSSSWRNNENKRLYTLSLTLIWFQIVKEKRKSRFSLCPLNGAIHSFLIARFFAVPALLANFTCARSSCNVLAKNPRTNLIVFSYFVYILYRIIQKLRTKDIGDIGESLVFGHECQRIKIGGRIEWKVKNNTFWLWDNWIILIKMNSKNNGCFVCLLSRTLYMTFIAVHKRRRGDG